VFGVSLLSSAFLLFSIQPIFGKMALPTLGGAPAVWNTCVVAFQATLLLGYAYAHALPARLPLRRQFILNAVLFACGGLFLPLGLQRVRDVSSDWPQAWLLLAFATSVGVPFLLLSTTAPLLQRWFAQTTHASARDPYFLYAASNAGSLIGLVGYPLLIEPRLDLSAQGRLWTAGYGAAALLCALSGYLASRQSAAGGRLAALNDPPRRTVVPLASRVTWALLAAVPASLMLGLTTFLTTDVAAVPLVWVVPLAIYLATFIGAFSIPGRIGSRWWRGAAAALLLTLIPATALQAQLRLLPAVLLHVSTFAVAAFACHARLAAARPAPEHLTRFYLWIALGGVVGGSFNTFIAPMAFTSVAEYPLAMAAACLLVAGDRERGRAQPASYDYILPGAVWLALAAIGTTVAVLKLPVGWAWPLYTAVAVFCLSQVAYRLRAGLCAGGLVVACLLTPVTVGDVVSSQRTFFGRYRVVDEAGGLRSLYHGTTLHGRESLAVRTSDPGSYYRPPAEVFKALRGGTPALRVGVIGLGAGSMAVYVEPGDSWTFFEIDPAVERIARRYFTYLARCGGRCQVVLGDARRSLTERRRHEFDVIVLDAFTSDAIPVHLLTREALDVYLDNLAGGGILAFHVSNRYLDLEPLVCRLSAERGLDIRSRFDKVTEGAKSQGGASAHWVVIGAPGHPAFGRLDGSRWTRPRQDTAAPLWTDVYSSLVSVIRRERS
jgi:hypothetical protein